MHTCPCFIKKNTPFLRHTLEKLGYVDNMRYCNEEDSDMEYLCAEDIDGSTWHFKDTGNLFPALCVTDMDSPEYLINLGRVYCGTNQNLFLALAALSDDNDFGQWFLSNSGNLSIQCTKPKFKDYLKGSGLKASNFHKATVEELKEKFRDDNDEIMCFI